MCERRLRQGTCEAKIAFSVPFKGGWHAKTRGNSIVGHGPFSILGRKCAAPVAPLEDCIPSETSSLENKDLY